MVISGWESAERKKCVREEVWKKKTKGMNETKRTEAEERREQLRKKTRKEAAGRRGTES